MKDIFCRFQNFFYTPHGKPERQERCQHQRPEQRRRPPGQPPTRLPEGQQIEQAAQAQPQRHEETELALSHNAAQQKQQQGRQQGIGQIQPEGCPPPGAEGAEQVIQQPQRHPQPKAQERLAPLCPRIDAHQLSRRPNSPFLGGAASR